MKPDLLGKIKLWLTCYRWRDEIWMRDASPSRWTLLLWNFKEYITNTAVYVSTQTTRYSFLSRLEKNGNTELTKQLLEVSQTIFVPVSRIAKSSVPRLEFRTQSMTLKTPSIMSSLLELCATDLQAQTLPVLIQ